MPQQRCALTLEVLMPGTSLRLACLPVINTPGQLRPETLLSSPQKKQHLQRSRGRRPRHSSQWSSSSSSNSSDSEGYGGSSSSSEDSGSEMELEESLEDGRALVPPQHRVPDIDLWVPTRKTTRQSQREGAGHYLEHRAVSYTLEATQSHPKEDSTTVSTPEVSQVQMPCETHSTVPRGSSSYTFQTLLANMEDPASKVGLSEP